MKHRLNKNEEVVKAWVARAPQHVAGSPSLQIYLKDVNLFELFDELMESYCEAVSQSKYEKTLKKIGQWVDEAREKYGIK